MNAGTDWKFRYEMKLMCCRAKNDTLDGPFLSGRSHLPFNWTKITCNLFVSTTCFQWA